MECINAFKNQSSKDDAECVSAILAGRRERFRELIERYQNRVFAILSRYERDRSRVEDIAQEVYVKAWQNLKKFDPMKAPFEHWLARIATNAALNHVRVEKRFRGQVPLSQLGEDALEWLRFEEKAVPLQAIEAREILDHCMGELSADEQVILTLAEIEGRKSPEISKLTGKAAGTIRVTLHRAKQKLADALFNLQGASEKRT